MRIDILTLFPDTLGDVLSESILGRAQERGFIRIEAHQIRDYTANKQNQVYLSVGETSYRRTASIPVADGTVLTGHAALADTMKDIIVDVLGSLLASTIGYFSIRKGDGISPP